MDNRKNQEATTSFGEVMKNAKNGIIAGKLAGAGYDDCAPSRGAACPADLLAL